MTRRGPTRAPAPGWARGRTRPGADRLDPARCDRVPCAAPAVRDRRVHRPRVAGAGGPPGRRRGAPLVVPDHRHAPLPVDVPLRPGPRGRLGPRHAPPGRELRGPRRGRPYRARAARPRPPPQADVRRGRDRDRWRVPRLRAHVPRAQRRARRRARDGLAGRGRPRRDARDVLDARARARARGARHPARRRRGEPIVGVYGPNPRTRADGDRGRDQVEAAAELLAERARSTCSAGGRSTRSPTCAGSWSATGPSPCASARWRAGPRRAARRYQRRTRLALPDRRPTPGRRRGGGLRSSTRSSTRRRASRRARCLRARSGRSPGSTCGAARRRPSSSPTAWRPDPTPSS